MLHSSQFTRDANATSFSYLAMWPINESLYTSSAVSIDMADVTQLHRLHM